MWAAFWRGFLVFGKSWPVWKKMGATLQLFLFVALASFLTLLDLTIGKNGWFAMEKTSNRSKKYWLVAKLQHFKDRSMKIFEVENFRNFSLKIVWKWKFLRSNIFDFFIFHTFSYMKNFRQKSEIFRSQKFSIFFNLRFWFWPKNPQIEAFPSIFFKIALDFQGGHDGTGLRSVRQLYLSFPRAFIK